MRFMCSSSARPKIIHVNRFARFKADPGELKAEEAIDAVIIPPVVDELTDEEEIKEGRMIINDGGDELPVDVTRRSWNTTVEMKSGRDQQGLSTLQSTCT
ncbi:hypothetical protein KM043_006038 [Ampulex compressa]|nr:hypothetical protein KM043_006038 [Ampulex compressa]